MKYPPVWTVWVLRDVPCIVGTANSHEEAEALGNSRVSTKKFVVRKYLDSDWEPEPLKSKEASEDENPLDLDSLPSGGVDFTMD